MVRALAIILITLITHEVHAYKLRETDSGHYVRWQNERVQITLDPSLALLGPFHKVERIIRESFNTWAETAGVPIEFEFEYGFCFVDELVSKIDDSNCVMASMLKKHWHKINKYSDVGATTVVSYQASDGKMVDADIVFNVIDWKWSSKGRQKDTLSISAVTDHEVGHLLGLAHSEVTEAVMYPIIEMGKERSNKLHEDDRAAIEILYIEIPEEEIESMDCAVMANSVDRSRSPWPLAAFFIILLYRRFIYSTR
ncbi:MAG: matrixin family metalloprotease [Proteobacteria bacterium]|nr:matrixin family metalloprotease [Pseudomonadota bacterium]